MPDMRLTTPHRTGDDVRALQLRLKERGYLHGGVDGEFGPDTARAVYRAKFWLGYRSPNQQAGPKLLALLDGKRTPTPAMHALAARRRREATRRPAGAQFVAVAASQEGETELPRGSNRCKFSLWYGSPDEWSAMFVTWVGAQLGLKWARRGVSYAYVPHIVADAKQGRNHLAVTYAPVEGDLVCFAFGGPGTTPDHVGAFVTWDCDGYFFTWEGNTSGTAAGSQNNGGQVARKRRHKSQVAAFVHWSA
jgi:peptidoglycan hydrolase-like protein with peptidoglycan-binding domain